MEPLLPGRKEDNNSSAQLHVWHQLSSGAKVEQCLEVTHSIFIRVWFATSENWEAELLITETEQAFLPLSEHSGVHCVVLCRKKPHPTSAPLSLDYSKGPRTESMSITKSIQ